MTVTTTSQAMASAVDPVVQPSSAASASAAAGLESAQTPEACRVVVLSYIHACGLVVDPPQVVDVFDHAARSSSGRALG